MTLPLHFGFPFFLVLGFSLLIVGAFFRYFFTRRAVYLHSMVSFLQAHQMTSHNPYRVVLSLLRFVLLFILAFLIGKPQLADTRTKVIVQGINIMLVLDVSGSMQEQNFSQDNRSRFEVAQEEAIRFINLRKHDSIGLVLFGKDTLSRCPLTLDKNILTSIVRDTRLGIVNPDGTVLSRGIVSAANRLKNSTNKSNIMIVLTDGIPTQDDIDPSIAIEIAKQLGIKIYTIGIGSDEPRPVLDQFLRIQMMPGLNKELLTTIAQQTGGKFFMARNAADMRSVYQTIDALEKSEIQEPLYTKYYDIFMPFLIAICLMFLLELLLKSTIWFSL